MGVSVLFLFFSVLFFSGVNRGVRPKFLSRNGLILVGIPYEVFQAPPNSISRRRRRLRRAHILTNFCSALNNTQHNISLFFPLPSSLVLTPLPPPPNKIFFKETKTKRTEKQKKKKFSLPQFTFPHIN